MRTKRNTRFWIVNLASASGLISHCLRLVGTVFAVVCGISFAILFYNLTHSFRAEPFPPGESDPIIDIWINKMLGHFFVFLPDNTVKLYQSYSFELDSVGRWQRVEDRPIYPESPKARLPSYKIVFEHNRVMDAFVYPIAHHYSIVIEDGMIGHRGYNRLSDADDPDRFYEHKFNQGLPQELSIVNGYWRAHHGRPSR